MGHRDDNVSCRRRGLVLDFLSNDLDTPPDTELLFDPLANKDLDTKSQTLLEVNDHSRNHRKLAVL